MSSASKPSDANQNWSSVYYLIVRASIKPVNCKHPTIFKLEQFSLKVERQQLESPGYAGVKSVKKALSVLVECWQIRLVLHFAYLGIFDKRINQWVAPFVVKSKTRPLPDSVQFQNK